MKIIKDIREIFLGKRIACGRCHSSMRIDSIRDIISDLQVFCEVCGTVLDLKTTKTFLNEIAQDD